MQISTREVNNVSIMTVQGRVDRVKAYELAAALRALVASNKTKIVLDLQDVEYISSAGLQALVTTLKTVRRMDGDVRLCVPLSHAREALWLGGLNSIFNIYLLQANAVSSF